MSRNERQAVSDAGIEPMPATATPRSCDPSLWLAARARGPHALEIAEAEGLLAPLLTGAGLRVDVVTHDPDGAAQARRRISEGAAPSGSIEVHPGPPSDVDWESLRPETGWSSVVVSGGLDTVVDPEAVLRRATQQAEPNAVVLIRVPLGLRGGGHPARWAFYPDDLLLLVLPFLVVHEIEIHEGSILLVGRPRREQDGETTLGEVRRSLGEDRLAAMAHDALETKERRAGQLGELFGRSAGLPVSRETVDEPARQELLDALRVTQKALQKSEQKRSGHYRQLRKTRTELAEKTRRLNEIYRSQRFRVATLVADGLRSPFAFLALPFRLVWALVRGGSVQTRSTQTATKAPAAAVAAPKSERPHEASAAGPARPVVTGPVLVPPAAPVRVDELRAAVILDDMSLACFAPECNLVTFTPDNWRQVLEERPPHLLFVESAWQGNGGSWRYKIGRYNHPDAEGLDDLLDWFRERDLPTVFWNKEDPVHFGKFEDAARRFDYVLTTDANVVERYEALEGSRIRRVEAMTFAAQPTLHNPVAAPGRSDSPCFAGSYYGNRHVARRKKMEMLLDAAREFDLVIYDRNHGSDNDDFRFPERFRRHIRGKLPYDRVVEAYKSHKVFLNVNSVEASPTMLSRRVFELLACGTAVVSTPSLAIDALFGDLVVTVETEDEARDALRRLLGDETARRELVQRGRRFVLERHTYERRFQQVAKLAGLGKVARRDRRAAAVLTGADVESAARMIELLRTQTTPPSALVLGVSDPSAIDGVERFLDDARQTLGRIDLRVVREEPNGDPTGRIRELAAHATAPWIFLADPSEDQSPELLRDLSLATQFAPADAIGLPVDPGAREQVYGGPIRPAPALVRRELIQRTGWAVDATNAHAFLEDLESRGARLYRIDRPHETAGW